MRTVATTVVVILIAVSVITGCRGAVTFPQPSEPPEQLMGFWTAREDLTDGKYSLMSLLFTPERFVFTWVRHFPDGEIDWALAESGTWTATDTHIHKRESYDETRDGVTTYHEDVKSQREYSMEHGALVVQDWGRQNSDDVRHTFTRASLDSFSILGSWLSKNEFPDAGTSEFTYTITDGDFVEEYRYFADGTLFWYWRVEGEIVNFDQDNHYLTVLVTDFVLHGLPAGPPLVDKEIRYAFSPSAVTDVMFISSSGNETVYDEETERYLARQNWWGAYALHVRRQWP